MVVALGLLVGVELALRASGHVAGDMLSSPLAYQSTALVETPVREVPQVSPPSLRWGVWRRVTPAEPPGYRVLVLGGSTTEGERVGPFQAFGGLLERELAVLLDRPVEVLNLGQGGFAARHVNLQLTAALAVQRPDLVVIYSGNNEYLEILGLKRALPHWSASQELARRRLWRLHLYRFMARHVVPAWNQGVGRPGQGMREHALTGEILEPERLLVEQLYEEAIASMAAQARQAGVPVLLATVADNLGGAPRLPGEFDGPTGDPDPRARQLADAPPERLAAILDDEATFNAADWHTLGSILYQQGRRDEGVRALLHAERLDARPHRSNHVMRASVLRVARDQGVASCDVAQDFIDAGAIGMDSFYDACHPNFDGHRRIADKLLACIARDELLPLTAAPGTHSAPLPHPMSLDGYTVGRIDDPAGVPDDGSWQAAMSAGHQAWLKHDHQTAGAAYDRAEQRGAPSAVLGRSRLLLRQSSADFHPGRELPALLDAADDPVLRARWPL